MRCSRCGSKNPDNAKFCADCGSTLIKTFCPQCGSAVNPGKRFCITCGSGLNESVGMVGTQAVSSPKRSPELVYAIIAGISAVIMLISLAIPWYAMRLKEQTTNISAADLLSDTGSGGLNGPLWVGSALPVILMIVCASIVLISVAFSIAGRGMKSLWEWLGTLSALCVIVNAVYILWYIFDLTRLQSGGSDGQVVNIVHVGSVLAFVGALVIMFTGMLAAKRARRLRRR